MGGWVNGWMSERENRWMRGCVYEGKGSKEESRGKF